MARQFLFLSLLLILFMAACAEGAAPERVIPPQFRPATLAEIPVDIPVMAAAGDLQIGVSGKSTHVRYQAPTTDVEVIVDYYDDALSDEGWQVGKLEDVVVKSETSGSATVVRVNNAGDSLTVDVWSAEGAESAGVEVIVVRAE